MTNAQMSTADFAYQSIRKMLSVGQLSAGQRVSQLRIAKELRCSTMPVVEALRRLESEGLLVKEPRKMARVRVLVAEELEGLYLTRQALEMAAARMCAQRIEDAEIGHLMELGTSFEGAAAQRDNTACDALDIEIHHFIVHCARCPIVETELSRLMLIERTVPGNALPRDWERYRVSHNALIQAIGHHDPDAAEYLMKRHIEVGFADMLQRVRLNPEKNRPTTGDFHEST